MSQKQKPNLAAALADAGGSARRRNIAPMHSASHERQTITPSKTEASKDADSGAGQGSISYQAPSRSGTAPITGHFPKQVRDQLKILAIEQGGTLHNLMAEAYNDLFAKYGKPEIAPHQP